MQATITISATVLPGRRIEITGPELRQGQRVAVTIADDAASYRRYPSALEAEYDTLIEKKDDLTKGQHNGIIVLGEMRECYLHSIRAEICRPASILPNGVSLSLGMEPLHVALPCWQDCEPHWTIYVLPDAGRFM